MEDIWSPLTPDSKGVSPPLKEGKFTWAYVVSVQTVVLVVLAWMIRPSCFLTSSASGPFGARGVNLGQIVFFSFLVSLASAYMKEICNALGMRPPFLRM